MYFKILVSLIFLSSLKNSKSDIVVLIKEDSSNVNSVLLTNIVEAVKGGNLQHPNELIGSQQLTIKNWYTIIEQLYSSKSDWIILLAKYGSSVEFGTNKLTCYAALRNFLQEKQTNEQFISDMFAFKKNNPEFTESTLPILNNPYLQFLVFEADTVRSVSKLFEETFVVNADIDVTKAIQQINWDKLAEQEISYVKTTETTAIQQLLTESLLKIYNRLDLNRLLYKVPQIADNVENNKLFKAYFYGSLWNCVAAKGGAQAQYLTKLSEVIESYVQNANLKIGSDYFNKYFNHLTKSIPSVLRNLLSSNENKIPVILKNVKYDEYLYSINWDKNWETAPANFGQSYYPVYTWRKRTVDETGKYFIEYENGHFWIRSGLDERRYVDLSHATNAHNPIIPPRSDKTALNIIPSAESSTQFYIQGVLTQHYMYAGSDDQAEDTGRRTIFSDGTWASRDTSYLWEISSFRIIN